MDEQELQKTLLEFERSRMQMMNVVAQKQQVQAQGNALADSLTALKKTTEKRVYKAVGNILILSDVGDVVKELTDQRESADLRVKTLQKQEDALIDKLNSLKAKIEAVQKAGTVQQPAQQARPEPKAKKK